MNLLNTELAKG